MKRYLPSGLVAILMVATGILYWPSLHHEPVFDDEALNTLLPHYGSLLEFKLRTLSISSFSWLNTLFEAHAFSPLQRLVNVLIHIGTIVGLYVLHIRLLAALAHEGTGRTQLPVAVMLGVALFALNPVAVYAVAYLMQRSILLATFFVVWGLVFFAQGLTSRSARWWPMIAALLCYAAALFSKEYAVTAPAAAWAIYIYLRRPSLRKIVPAMLVALLVFGAVVFWLVSVYPHLLGRPFDALSREFVLELEQLAPGSAAAAYPLSILNQMSLFPRYLLLWVVPWTGWMSIDLRPPFPLSLLSWPHLLGAAIYLATFVGGLGLLIWGRAARWRFVGLCLFSPAALFATEFVTVWIQDPFVLYRSYLWAIMLPGLFALGFARLRLDNALALGAVLAALFGVLAADRVASMQNPFTVWNDAAEKVDQEASPNAVGRWRAFMNRGSFHLGNRALASAGQDFETAARLGEPLGTAQYSLGTVRNMEGRTEDALKALNTAEQIGFRDAALYYQRALAHRKLEQSAAALADYTEMIKRADDPRVRQLGHRERGELALQNGRADLAIEDIRFALEHNPGQPELLFNLGMLQIATDAHEAAKESFRTLLRANPANPAAHYGLALAYFESGAIDDARYMIERAVRMEPGNALYRRLAADIQRAGSTVSNP